MAIENSTGKILAFVGGRDPEIEMFNHSTQAFRQNASTMKPLLVYAPAIEYGLIGAGSPVADVWFETYKYGKRKLTFSCKLFKQINKLESFLHVKP